MEVLILYAVTGVVFGLCVWQALKWVDTEARMPKLEGIAVVVASALWPLAIVGGVVGILLAWVTYLLAKRG